MIINILLLIAILSFLIHFTAPLSYYFYLKVKWFKKPWNINIDKTFQPAITVIIPTYNEGKNIAKKLDNLIIQTYPINLIEIIVTDDNSTDDTLDITNKWKNDYPNIKLKLLKNDKKRGKILNMLEALKYVSNELIMITDADVLLEHTAIEEAIKYFSDKSVGVVTASLKPDLEINKKAENTYKKLYNVVRISESKIHSTPIHNGALFAIRKKLLQDTLFHKDAEDCYIGSFIAFSGYRAIQADDVWAQDPIRKSYFKTKFRRAYHNILAFLTAKKYAKEKGVYVRSVFDKVWKVEWFIYMVNPWILLFGGILLIYNAIFSSSIISIIMLFLGILLLFVKEYRTWLLHQSFLLFAMLRVFFMRK